MFRKFVKLKPGVQSRPNVRDIRMEIKSQIALKTRQELTFALLSNKILEVGSRPITILSKRSFPDNNKKLVTHLLLLQNFQIMHSVNLTLKSPYDSFKIS